ncbi:hypothetical protein ACS0TY_028101 [Phlomoides rotata]
MTAFFTRGAEHRRQFDRLLYLRSIELGRWNIRNRHYWAINLRGLDGIQGPVYVDTGCVSSTEQLCMVMSPLTNLRIKKLECYLPAFVSVLHHVAML